MRIRRQATDGEKTETSPKKTDRWQISTWKEPPHHMSSRKCKLKQQDATACPLEGKIQKLSWIWQNPKHWQHQISGGWGAIETLIHCLWECKMVQPLCRIVWFLTMLNILWLYDAAIMLPGIYSKEWKTHLHTKTCTLMFIAALLIIAETWKKPRCPSVGKEINKLSYTQTMEYYLALKRNELLRLPW